MKIPGISFFAPVSRSVATRPTAPVQLPADRLELSGTSAGPSSEGLEKPKFAVRSLPLQRLTTIGMAALCFFGALVADVSGQAVSSKTPQPPAVQELLPKTPEIGVDGWIVAGAGLKDVAAPATLPDKPPTPEPFKLSTPKAGKHDYVKHGVNFSQLVSDKEFTDTTALDVIGVQAFLEDQNSFLAQYKENKISAAEIIFEASQKAGINPYILLTTLEKESSLITRQKQPKEGLMAASMGYGYTDGGTYTAGAKSFTGQVNKGASLLARLFKESQSQKFPMKYKADYGKHKVQIDNAATLALFQYTPHTVDTGLKVVGGGNYRFREVLEDFTRPLKD
ncbi:MAG: hypothetical protein J0I12_18795 [Candidatus Eremiobacteraeota bacterium]|nr:hypothetical protein [Candidatus Eremiobacteraeota bacterium]